MQNPVTSKAWNPPPLKKKNIFHWTRFLEKPAGILLPAMGMVSNRLIQFVALSCGQSASRGKKGSRRKQYQMLEGSRLGPWGKTHNLEMTKPLRKFIRTSGHLIKDYQALRGWSKPLFKKNRLLRSNSCQRVFFCFSSPSCFFFPLSPSFSGLCFFFSFLNHSKSLFWDGDHAFPCLAC